MKEKKKIFRVESVNGRNFMVMARNENEAIDKVMEHYVEADEDDLDVFEIGDIVEITTSFHFDCF